MADRLARKYVTVGGIVQAVERAIAEGIAAGAGGPAAGRGLAVAGRAQARATRSFRAR